MGLFDSEPAPTTTTTTSTAGTPPGGTRPGWGTAKWFEEQWRLGKAKLEERRARKRATTPDPADPDAISGDEETPVEKATHRRKARLLFGMFVLGLMIFVSFLILRSQTNVIGVVHGLLYGAVASHPIMGGILAVVQWLCILGGPVLLFFRVLKAWRNTGKVDKDGKPVDSKVRFRAPVLVVVIGLVIAWLLSPPAVLASGAPETGAAYGAQRQAFIQSLPGAKFCASQNIPIGDQSDLISCQGSITQLINNGNTDRDVLAGLQQVKEAICKADNHNLTDEQATACANGEANSA